MGTPVPLTVFRWGYWGWGNATPQLVQAVDAIEAARGFAPPVFVDARILRSVRAVGFRGNAFAEQLGNDRYIWMDGLGNLGVLHRTGGCHINRPADAGRLLDLAETNAAENRRVVFFCSCEIPLCNGQECHRVEVGRLVLAEAKRRKRSLVVVEWPGGTPTAVTLAVSADVVRKVRGGTKSVPLGKTLPAADRLGLPWGTVAELTAPGNVGIAVLTGPARFGPPGWELPVAKVLSSDANREAESTTLRAAHMYDPATT